MADTRTSSSTGKITRAERIAGCLFGSAFGDALGAKPEFLGVADILKRWPPNGPQEPEGSPMRVTDDTQMALAVGEALVEAWPLGPLSAETLEPKLRKAFVRWLHSPDNTRAPGVTCVKACSRLDRGLPWVQATAEGSKGCGANMRVAPVALLPRELSDGTPTPFGAISQFQAAMTHGHPTALPAADLTVKAILELLDGVEPLDLPARLRAHAASGREVYHEDWLADLWNQGRKDLPQWLQEHQGRGNVQSGSEVIASGWDACDALLVRLEAAVKSADRDSDPCLATGEGWVAEEALATGLLCFLLFPNDPLAAVRRAAVTSGDSDSIACLTGAFAGTAHGIQSWPESWREEIEYRPRLEALAQAFSHQEVLAAARSRRMKIVVKTGDVLEETADVLLCSANPQLNLSGGVGGALLLRGGEDVQRELHEIIRQRDGAPVAEGTVARTGPGPLSVKHVLHCVALNGFYDSSLELLQHVVALALENAQRLEAETIAMPALATGYGPLSMKNFGDAMGRVLDRAEFPFEELRIVLRTEESAEVVRQALGSRLG
ncbi:MAG: ADP-ribosylglycohydrolase family protein [Planctomycetales bacterium]